MWKGGKSRITTVEVTFVWRTPGYTRLDYKRNLETAKEQSRREALDVTELIGRKPRFQPLTKCIPNKRHLGGVTTNVDMNVTGQWA
jgi:hypothetical protein